MKSATKKVKFWVKTPNWTWKTENVDKNWTLIKKSAKSQILSLKTQIWPCNEHFNVKNENYEKIWP